MKCPAPERFAEAATTGLDDELIAHAADCAECRALFAEQREVRSWTEHVPDAVLSHAHRESLAAEVLARADALPPSRRPRVVPIVAAALAIAAIVALAVYLPRREQDAPATAVAPPPPPPPVHVVTPPPAPPPPPAHEVVAPAPPPAIAKARIGGSGELTRETRGDRDIVNLSGGEVTVDAVGTKAATVVNGDTAVGVKGAKVKVIAKRGVIAQVAVFAGSAEVTVAGKSVVIEAGMTWDRNASREDALAAFRTGWEALRAGDNAAALEAFDRATDDDVVAEDAVYWGAIAAERMNDRDGAIRRYRALIERFPKSPRADAATLAIARLSS